MHPFSTTNENKMMENTNSNRIEKYYRKFVVTSKPAKGSIRNYLFLLYTKKAFMIVLICFEKLLTGSIFKK